MAWWIASTFAQNVSSMWNDGANTGRRSSAVRLSAGIADAIFASAERAPLAKRAPPQVSSMRAPVASAASSSAVNVSGGRLALRFSR